MRRRGCAPNVGIMPGQASAPAPTPPVLSRQRRVAGRPPWRWAADLLLIAGGCVSLILEPLSIALHSIAGLAFAALTGPHLWHRRTWIRATLRRLRQRRRLPAGTRRNLAQSVLLAALVLAVTVSGLWDWLDTRTHIRYHAISSVLLVAVALRHGWTRRSKLARRDRKEGSGSSRGRFTALKAAGVARSPARPRRRSRSW